MNRLAQETSPYLLQHADNPVDWHPWGEEAFELARAQDRPILLSVGYSACHWCHVMEHESFEDAETAEMMNRLFVNVKVDREERPDVDGVYMDAVVALTGHGGWPMTVFLTPEGEPFWGGTYFPPEPRGGMPAFRSVLEAVANAFATRRGEIGAQAGELVEAIRRGSAPPPSRELLTTALLADAVVTLSHQYDPAHGGFGGAPKFPPAPTVEFLLRTHLRTGAEPALAMASGTLDAMAAGGVYDQLGGGFHRYAVDERWLVPHFEKMLYDNALLASAYLHGFLVAGKPRYREVCEETLDYLLREMRLSEGGFASAQDADTHGEEGLTYVWAHDELVGLLPAQEAELVLARYGVTAGGNFEGANVLHLAAEPEDPEGLLSSARARLLEARSRRPQPARDDKALAAWNGLTLAAFSEAGLRLSRPDYLEAAEALAAFLLGPLSRPSGRLHRSFRAGQAKGVGFLEDYAAVASGLLELYTATGRLRYLEEARRLALLAIELFADDEEGGFFFTPADGEQLVARKKELADQPTPSGNSLLASVLIRLARLYGEEELEHRAVDVFRLAYGLLERAPSAVGHLLCALELHFAPPREVAIVGPAAAAATRALRDAALERFSPDTVYAFADGPDDPAAGRVPLLAGKPLVGGRPAAYVCRSFACRAPVTEPDELRRELAA